MDRITDGASPFAVARWDVGAAGHAEVELAAWRCDLFQQPPQVARQNGDEANLVGFRGSPIEGFQAFLVGGHERRLI